MQIIRFFYGVTVQTNPYNLPTYLLMYYLWQT
jgi:hypothetical protein